ncbi:FGGY family carbohydrate kinase [Actinomadura rugatobispora]|uniref:FGGY family carbohydrate kinase n=1 Tax=Actinomadura rugatobispora TaxID=1994 RepID=A0ABW1A8Q7_9ACTN|nr:FGGY-family carbohydrate kinase [Actinomadura rugatobispora]
MFVGIDAGTSVVKAAAFGAGGEILAVESVPVPLDMGDGRVEQDVETVYGAVERVVRALVAGLPAPPELAGLTGQGDGLWLVDAAARPVRPAISWLDGRATGLLTEWMAGGTAAEVWRATGSALFPGAPAPVLAWLDRHEPESLDAAATAAYCKDVIFQRFTGIRATDVSDASMPFLDPRTRAYHRGAIEACGLAHRAGLLAPVADPLPLGEAGPGGTGLPAGTPVAGGPFDLPACALGAGVTEPGDGLLIIGTTLACQVVVDRLELDAEPSGYHLATTRPGRWLRAMPAMVGTAALDWTLRTAGLRHDAMAGLLAESPPGAGGVKVLPYFAPSGERAPFVETRARAEFTGVSLETTRADLVRATCEGIAYAARHCLDTAGLTGELAVCGGGTRSEAWLQLFTDVLGRPVRVAAGEVGARGAVLAAAERLGTPLDTKEWTAAAARYEPDPVRAAFYAEGYADYLGRVAAARERWAAAA